MKEYFTKKFCDRCGQRLIVRKMSRFNTDCLCEECISKEKQHKNYRLAADAELNAVKSGVENYPGIGLSEDMYPRGFYSVYVQSKNCYKEFKFLGELRNYLCGFLSSDEIDRGELQYLTTFDKLSTGDCILNTRGDDIKVAYYPTSDKCILIDESGHPLEENEEIVVFDSYYRAVSYLKSCGCTEDIISAYTVLHQIGKCVKCGSPLYHSLLPGYTYQCFNCDEDFYSIEQGNDTIPVWKIPVCWEMVGFVEIQAPTLDDAMDIARNDESIELPEGTYVDGSWALSIEDTECVRQCYNNNQQDAEVQS